MHKNFSFKGVVRSNDNILSAEGECIELVNLRMVNGSLRPVPECVEKTVLQGSYSDIYWHDKAECYLCISDSNVRSVDFYDAAWQPLLDKNGARLQFPLLKKVRKVEFLGYVAVCITDGGIQYLIYSDSRYRWLGNSPAVPVLKITPESKVHSVDTTVTFSTSTVDTPISSLWKYNSRGYFDECISNANKEGYFIDRALFRFALRLYDGSYIYTSHIIYVSDEAEIDGVSRDKGNLVAVMHDSSSVESRYRVNVLGFKPKFEFENLNLDDWEGVVVGIDIFSTGSIMGNKISESRVSVLNTETKQRTYESVEIYKPKELDELWNEINDASLYYKVAEFDIRGKEQIRLEDVSQANIVLQDALSSFEQRHSMSLVVPDCSYMFNNRLHIASLREYFSKGYDHSALLPAGVEKRMLDMVVVQTKIKTGNGISTLLNSFENIYIGYGNGKYQLPPLLSYPDSRAFEMSVFIYYETGLFMKRFDLVPHKYLNISQYLHKGYSGYDVKIEFVFANGPITASLSDEKVLDLFNEEVGTHEVIFSTASNGWTYKGKAFPPAEYSSERIFGVPRNVQNGDKILFIISEKVTGTSFADINNIPFDSSWEVISGPDDYGEENVYETRENVMNVSMVENPFIFPAKCTYPLSQGRITALSTNRAAMSEGQFGQHPLYVFSQEGIQVMAVDTSGTTAYSNMYPVSHEVCQNARMVCGTDSGVLFLGTQGVMLISGSRCVRLSLAMDNESKGYETAVRSEAIGQIASIYGLRGMLNADRFMDFMRGAKAARNAEMNEIIFSNSDYSYSYICSLSGNVWSRTNMFFNGFITADGTLAMFRNDGVRTRVYAQGDNYQGGNRVLLVTRPLMFGTKMLKRIMQLMLHAYLAGRKGSDGTSAFVSCFLLCSNDGVHFKLVTGCERKSETQDIVFPYFPTQSYRYFIFALAGNLDVMSMVTGLELDVNPAWSNRLR